MLQNDKFHISINLPAKPGAMSVIRIMTNFNIELEFPAAPFHRRLIAWILDIIILFFYGWLAVEVIFWFDSAVGNKTSLAVFIILLIPMLTYHLICEATMNGQSFGKKMMGIRVVNETGGQPGIGQLTVRWLIRTSDMMAFSLILSVPMAAANGNANFFWQVAIPLGLFMTDIILVNASKNKRKCHHIRSADKPTNGELPDARLATGFINYPDPHHFFAKTLPVHRCFTN